MVLITEEQGKESKVKENGFAGGVALGKTKSKAIILAGEAPLMSICKVDEDGVECVVSEDDANEEAEVDYTRNYWEDEDDIYQEFEELDFDSLPDRSDTHSITTEDSFYPLDDSVISQINRSLYQLETPEPISFFKACCNNNAIIVKIMIRQGVTEEEVKETDRNRRVGVWVQCPLHFFIFC